MSERDILNEAIDRIVPPPTRQDRDRMEARAPIPPARRAPDQLEQLVALCWRDGHLYGARASTASKTLTVRGKRRYRIRLQSDICAVIMGQAQNVTPHYPDLSLDICDDVAELREAER